ncbi:hexokinase A [Nowakowskiella sp. JEL0407]|nr:hexokinase A [Nowakowskiella sp. JEL0407]
MSSALDSSAFKSPVFLFGLTTGIALSAVVQYVLSYVATPQTQKSSLSVPVPAIVPPQTISVPLAAHIETITRLEKDFTINTSMMQKIVKQFVNEMRKGLLSDGQTLKMIPSYVCNRPRGDEVGSVLALDLGGSNFRVCEVILEGQKTRLRQKKFVISDALKNASGTDLFDFFAECVSKFVEEHALDLNVKRKLGFTFSFPIEQTAINKGTLMHWNKGFTSPGVVDKDVVELLADAFARKGLHNIEIAALVNDTVGTLMSHAYLDSQTHVGVILGTGTNAAYFEPMDKIPKWRGGPVPSNEMVVNTEWGAFDNEQIVLPVTKFDRRLDRASPNPQSQIFEKMISGMYLGEIVRQIILDLIGTGELFRGQSSENLQTPYHFETAYMSRIERDHTTELSDTKAVLEDILNIPSTTESDRRLVKRICELVGIRSARLSAAGVAAVVTKINRFDGCTIAIDGSLFAHYPHYANRMRDALREVLGLTAENIVLEQARDGSGQGAALIAATASY